MPLRILSLAPLRVPLRKAVPLAFISGCRLGRSRCMPRQSVPVLRRRAPVGHGLSLSRAASAALDPFSSR